MDLLTGKQELLYFYSTFHPQGQDFSLCVLLLLLLFFFFLYRGYQRLKVILSFGSSESRDLSSGDHVLTSQGEPKPSHSCQNADHQLGVWGWIVTWRHEVAAPSASLLHDTWINTFIPSSSSSECGREVMKENLETLKCCNLWLLVITWIEMLAYLKNPLKPYLHRTSISRACVCAGLMTQSLDNLTKYLSVNIWKVTHYQSVQARYIKHKMFPIKCCHAFLPSDSHSSVFSRYFTQSTPYKAFHSHLCLSASLSTGVTDKEPAFMHEEGIRDPSFLYQRGQRSKQREHMSEKQSVQLQANWSTDKITDKQHNCEKSDTHTPPVKMPKRSPH